MAYHLRGKMLELITTKETRTYVTLCFQFEPNVTLLEEAYDLVCCRNSRVVICLQCLCTHLLLREDNTFHVLVTDELFNGRFILRSNVGQVAKVSTLLQDLQKVCLMNHFHTGSVDEGAAFRQF